MLRQFHIHIMLPLNHRHRHAYNAKVTNVCRTLKRSEDSMTIFAKVSSLRHKSSSRNHFPELHGESWYQENADSIRIRTHAARLLNRPHHRWHSLATILELIFIMPQRTCKDGKYFDVYSPLQRNNRN